MAERDVDAFEARLAERLVGYARVPVAPVDAAAVAHEVVGAARRRGRVVRLFEVRLPAVVWVVLALMTAIAAGLLAGALLRELRPPPGQPLVLALEDGLYLADERGEARALLRDDGSFMGPRWSPDGGRIAVLHGPPIPPQTGEPGASPRTPVPFELVAAELLLLDEDGATRSSVPGPVVDFAWSPPLGDGRSLLAVGTVDGRVVVLDDGGRTIAGLRRASAATPEVTEAPLRPSGLAWTSSGVLLVASGGRLLAMDPYNPAAPRVVAEPGTSHVGSLALDPEGIVVALLATDCVSGCRGDARVVRLSPNPASGAAARGAPGRTVLRDVPAGAALSWHDDGRSLLAWPRIGDAGGRIVRDVGMPPEVGVIDVVAGLTRYADDGSGRILLLNAYPYFNDRHFDAWLLHPDGSATRVATRSLGFDLRVPPGSAD